MVYEGEHWGRCPRALRSKTSRDLLHPPAEPLQDSRRGGEKKRRGKEGGECLLGRMEEGAPGPWGWRRELGVCERIAGVRS